MATRSAFNDDSYQMYRMDNVLDSVNLNVIGWNRATVADGQWLQDNAIGPLSARDMYLADCIDDIWGSVNSINQTLDNMGAETTGVNTFGFTMKSVNIAQAESPSAAYLPNNVNWDRKQVSLVTTGVGDTYMTPGSISLLTFTNASEKIGGIDPEGLGDNMGALLQVNTTANEAYQLAFTPNALYYRRISDGDGQTVPLAAGHAGTNLYYKEEPPDFSAFPLGAMDEEQINAKLAGYLTTNAAQSTYLAKADASTTYQTIAGMSNYLTTNDASTTYQPIAGMSNYLTTTDASTTYLSKTDASTTYLSKTDASTTYLSKSDASTTYLSKSDASTTYLTKTDAQSTYLTDVRTDTTLTGDGTAGNALGLAVAVEDTTLQLTSAGTGTQASLSVWLQSIIDAIEALQPQQPQQQQE